MNDRDRPICGCNEEEFNRAIDTNDRLRQGLEKLARAYPDISKDEYVDEMLRLFREAGVFLSRGELEKLLVVRRRKIMSKKEQ